jgi:hypothetical protein
MAIGLLSLAAATVARTQALCTTVSLLLVGSGQNRREKKLNYGVKTRWVYVG